MSSLRFFSKFEILVNYKASKFVRGKTRGKVTKIRTYLSSS